jgi:RNA polymerase sigma-19 factor, ECF subfamily
MHTTQRRQASNSDCSGNTAAVNIKKYALEQFYRHNYQHVRVYARRRKRNIDVDDVVQEAFLRVMEGEGIAQIKSPKMYMRRIVSNLIVDEFRKNTVRERECDQDYIKKEDTACHYQYEMALQRQMQLNQVADLLDNLPDLYKKSFILHYIQGYNQREISSIVGVSSKSVDRYLKKALDYLSNHLV